ncbi:MAG: hypothetical protein N2442_04045 [Spirochaetes bacterium]|nr:hypothetical protein [Spirochaetota bacterium]
MHEVASRSIRKRLLWLKIHLKRILGEIVCLSGALSLAGGCSTFLTSSIPYSLSTQAASEIEVSISRVPLPPRGELKVSIPLEPALEDVSFPSYWSGKGGIPSPANAGPFFQPELREEEEVSFPRWRRFSGTFPSKPFFEEAVTYPPLPALSTLSIVDRIPPVENPSLPPGKPSQPTIQPKATPPKEDPARQAPPKETSKKEMPIKEEPKPPPRSQESFPIGKSVPVDSQPEKRVEGEVGKTVRIVLPGIGWIYLGEKDRLGKVKYLGRDTGTDSTTFTFSILQEGDAVLQFQQQDLLAKSITYDAVLVTTSRASKQPPLERKDGKDLSLAPSRGETASSVPSVQGPTTKEELSPAKLDQLIKEGKRKEAVRWIEEYLQSEEGKGSQERDRWYFTLAQLYEGEGDVKDIKKALFYYETVRDQFPFSSYWEEADYKTRYIRRNYFEIR